MGEKAVKCLRCDKKMDYIMTENIQLGKHSFFFGDWAHLLAGGLEVKICICPECGKIEFFHAGGRDAELPQVVCPNCGKMHDFDYPKCPYCNYIKE